MQLESGVPLPKGGLNVMNKPTLAGIQVSGGHTKKYME